MGLMKTVATSFTALSVAALVPAAFVIAYYAIGTFFQPGAFEDSFAWVRIGNFSALALVVSAAHVFALGLPVAVLAIWTGQIRWWVAVLAGFAVGCIPIGWMSWPLKYPEMKTTTRHWNGERMVDTMVNGVPTIDGWLQYALGTAVFGALGAVGGLAFWLVWKRCK